jgi:hypothetical protein
MAIATYLLFTLGILGATDILLYHSISHGIRTNPDSRHELFVHGLRGPTYATLFLVVPNLALHGVFWWLLMGLLVFDLAISIWDFFIESESRRFLGGLPSGEYVLHIVLAMVFGAFVTSAVFESGHNRNMASSIAYEPVPVPTALRALLAVMAFFVLVSAAWDFWAAYRLSGQPKRSVQ